MLRLYGAYRFGVAFADPNPLAILRLVLNFHPYGFIKKIGSPT